MQLAQTHLDEPVTIPETSDMSEYFGLIEKFEISKAADYVWSKITELDREIQEKRPWETKDKSVIMDMVLKLYFIARLLNPIMPVTNAKLKAMIKANKKPENLFPRLNAS
jgi:methionyl-tRNA synthetase